MRSAERRQQQRQYEPCEYQRLHEPHPAARDETVHRDRIRSVTLRTGSFFKSVRQNRQNPDMFLRAGTLPSRAHRFTVSTFTCSSSATSCALRS